VTRVLIIVQNLPASFGQRVWLECRALVLDGHQVTIVCPNGKSDPAYQAVSHLEVCKYRPDAPGGRKLSFNHRVRPWPHYPGTARTCPGTPETGILRSTAAAVPQ